VNFQLIIQIYQIYLESKLNYVIFCEDIWLAPKNILIS